MYFVVLALAQCLLAQDLPPACLNFTVPKADLKYDRFDSLYSCPELPKRMTPATDVRDLRPDDIGAVIAFGDSLLAGLNSGIPITQQALVDKCNGNQSMVEFRGMNFATGGDENVFSVAKAVQRYNPSVAGLSSSVTSFEYCFGFQCPAGTDSQPFNSSSWGLNAANSGAWVIQKDILNQFRYLDEYYATFVHKDEQPWNLAVIALGFNNMCWGCKKWAQLGFFSPDHFESNIKFLLNQIRQRYPKTLAVLVPPFSYQKLMNVISASPTCDAIRSAFFNKKKLCNCLEAPDDLKEIDRLAREYASRVLKIAQEFDRLNYTTFGVIADIGFHNLDFSNVSVIDTLSGVDCFHPNARTHERLAVSLWNNLFRPQSEKKSYQIRESQAIHCPTADSRIVIG